MEHYRLVNKRPVPCTRDEWIKSLRNERERIVKQTEIGPIFVSTIFLGSDHNFSDEGPPLLFETMVFDGNEDDYQTRQTTWDEAIAEHDRVCAKYSEMAQSATLLTDDVLTKKS
jgi:hypothetical protein